MIKRSAPLRKHRLGVRRGRVVDRKYLAWVAEQPCCVSGCYVLDGERVTVHHVREFGSPKNDHRTIPLLARYHLATVGGRHSIEVLGKVAFQVLYDIEITDVIASLNASYLRDHPERRTDFEV